MNARSMKVLAAVAALLLAGVLLVQSGRDGDGHDAGRWLEGFEAELNDVSRVTVESADGSATIERRADGWIVAERDGYPADTGKLRTALIALAEAEALEPKTAQPDRHAQLGLSGERAVTVTIAAADSERSLVIGDSANQGQRYVRRAGEDQAWLIDRSPEFPGGAADWLQPELMDIARAAVETVAIRHEGGDELLLSKSEAGQLEVANLPEGRELRYASIANGLAGALQGLEVADVRPAENDAAADVTTVITTNDGLKITARRHADGDAHWFSFTADTMTVGSGDGDESSTSGERAATITARTQGWQFRLPDHKADLLARRWDDLLQPEDEN